MARSLEHLPVAFDTLETACSWVQGSECLGNETPEDLVASRPEAVIEAARIDRFIAIG